MLKPQADGYKYVVGEDIVIEDDYERDGVFLTANTKAKILSRTKSQLYVRALGLCPPFSSANFNRCRMETQYIKLESMARDTISQSSRRRSRRSEAPGNLSPYFQVEI